MPGTSGVTAEGPPNISHSAGRVPRRGPVQEEPQLIGAIWNASSSRRSMSRIPLADRLHSTKSPWSTWRAPRSEFGS